MTSLYTKFPIWFFLDKNFSFRRALDLQKDREDSTESSWIPHTQFPLLYGTFVTGMNKYWYVIINWSLYLIQISLVFNLMFCFPVQGPILEL